MRAAVIIMSRVPRPGKTKTRLMSNISARECADFHRAALRDICCVVRQADLCGYIYYVDDQVDMNNKKDLTDPLWSLSEEDACHLQLRPQRGSDLGTRMQNAAAELLHDYEVVVLVGSDAPELSTRHIQQTLTLLNMHDLVLGPAEDGGYYLLAMKKAYTALFAGVPWGTSEVLRATLVQARSLNLSYALLQPLADIDTWQDLLRFAQAGARDEASYASLAAFQYAQYLLARYTGLEKEIE